MKITWYGHSCFKLENGLDSVVFDPYEDNFVPGLKLPAVSAGTVVCSHQHGDHNASEKVASAPGKADFLPGMIDCFHDEAGGKKRGKNIIWLMTSASTGFKAAHMGDLGHRLDEEQLARLRRVDVLMIPVGGFYTIDAATAKKLCEEIRPKIIIPMHYRTGSTGLQNIAPADDFLKLFDGSEILRLDGSSWEYADIPQRVVVFGRPEQ